MAKYVRASFDGYGECEKGKIYYFVKNGSVYGAEYQYETPAHIYFREYSDICKQYFEVLISSCCPVYESAADAGGVCGIVDAMKKAVKIPGPQYGIRLEVHGAKR